MKRTALVIGNAAYTGDPLSNPRNDAEDVAEKLRTFGFSVEVALDSSNLEMEKALGAFRGELHDADVGLFFFAGHGVQIEGSNFLLALDTNRKSSLDAKHSSLPLDKVIDVMASAHTPTSIIILDACRDNPWEKRWDRSAAFRGLASVYAPRGTLIAFATSPGQVALDGAGKRNGSYTEALLEHIGAPDCTVEAMFKRVRNTLNVSTGAAQISWEHTSLAQEFFFNLSVGARIDIYRGTSLRDSALELDSGKASHRLITALKSHTWPRQNSAIEDFDMKAAGVMSKDNLFVIGRNVYQASCGGSHAAAAFIKNFATRTNGLEAARRKALLDGMLFEIFFDSAAEFRGSLKNQCFNEVFDLQKHTSLNASFEFIVECLLPFSHKFHVLPGRSDKVVLDVMLRSGAASGKAPKIKKICLAAKNVLRSIDDEAVYSDEDAAIFRTMSEDAFRDLMSAQLVVPLWRLSVSYTGTTSTGEIRFPSGFSVRKTSR